MKDFGNDFQTKHIADKALTCLILGVRKKYKITYSTLFFIRRNNNSETQCFYQTCGTGSVIDWIKYYFNHLRSSVFQFGGYPPTLQGNLRKIIKVRTEKYTFCIRNSKPRDYTTF